MDGIIEEVRQEYETVAQRSKAEVDAKYQGRVSRHQQDRSQICLLSGKETKNICSLLCTSVPGPSEHVGKST